MINYKIDLPKLNPTGFFGANNATLKYFSGFFPTLKISSRGTQLNVEGDTETIEEFQKKLNLLIFHYEKYNSLTKNNVENLMLKNGHELISSKKNKDAILFGNGGVKITARTVNQKKLVTAVNDSSLVFAIGPAGTGKTYTAVALAVRALKEKEVKKIILTRPAVEAGENLGFLPGDLKEKLDPYLMPLYDALRDMIPSEKLKEMLEDDIIQIAPLAFMRGRTLDKAFVILDEAQNTSEMQMKMFLTRMGKTAKFIVTGDLSQVDIPKKQFSGLAYALKCLGDIPEIKIIKLGQSDVIRHKLVKKIIAAFEKNEDSKNKTLTK